MAPMSVARNEARRLVPPSQHSIQAGGRMAPMTPEEDAAEKQQKDVKDDPDEEPRLAHPAGQGRPILHPPGVAGDDRAGRRPHEHLVEVGALLYEVVRGEQIDDQQDHEHQVRSGP
jgi:hypothetical protein